MREIEFLPDWYPRMRRHRRMVTLQGWLSLLIAVALLFWFLSLQRNVQARERELADVSEALVRSQSDVERLDVLLDLQRQLREQDEIFAKIGRPIEATRLLTMIDDVMPRGMALLDLTLETEEPRVESISAKARQERTRTTPRRLRMKVRGVAPSDADLADFLDKLTDRTFLSQVGMSYSRPRTDSGRLMREFEVGFVVDLSELGGG